MPVVDFTDKEVAFLIRILDSWGPCSRRGRTTKAEDRFVEAIEAKLHSGQSDEEGAV